MLRSPELTSVLLPRLCRTVPASQFPSQPRAAELPPSRRESGDDEFLPSQPGAIELCPNQPGAADLPPSEPETVEFLPSPAWRCRALRLILKSSSNQWILEPHLTTWSCAIIRSLEPPSFLCPSLESPTFLHSSLEPTSSLRAGLESPSSLQPSLEPRSSLSLSFKMLRFLHSILEPPSSLHFSPELGAPFAPARSRRASSFSAWNPRGLYIPG